jgi:hypothetical protein
VIRTVISAFKQQQRIHLNDFASQSAAPENDAYTTLAWGDTRETYTPAKRGNLVAACHICRRLWMDPRSCSS